MKSLINDADIPVDGDKIICLRNYWEYMSEDENPLVNGTIGYLQNSFQTWQKVPSYIRSSISQFDVLVGDIIITNNNIPIDTYYQVHMDQQMILTEQKCCDWKTSYMLERVGILMPKEFAYAYAITVHKAQGSEWDKVVVLEESFPFNKEEHARWLYTACTRASKKLVLIR